MAFSVGQKLTAAAANGFLSGQRGTFSVAFSAINAVSGTLTFPSAFSVAPGSVQGTVQVAGNNDILLNWTAAPSATGVAWRVFQKAGTAVTLTAVVHWEAII